MEGRTQFERGDDRRRGGKGARYVPNRRTKRNDISSTVKCTGSSSAECPKHNILAKEGFGVKISRCEPSTVSEGGEKKKLVIVGLYAIQGQKGLVILLRRTIGGSRIHQSSAYSSEKF